MVERRSKVTCILFILIVGIFIHIPSGQCRSPFEYIIAGYNKDSVNIQGNLTYPTDDWYFNIPKAVMFKLIIQIPDDIVVDVNFTRLLFFLDFRDEDPEYGFVTPFNQTNLLQSSFDTSSIVHNDTYSLIVNDNEVQFIPEWSNWVVFGFLVTLDLGIHNNGTYDQIDQVNIYSSKPNSVDWTYSPGMYTNENEDRFWFYKYSNPFDPSSNILLIAFVGGLFFFCILSTLYRASEMRQRRRKANLKNYIKKKAEIHGRIYNLGGIRVTLAYYMTLAFPKLHDEYSMVVSDWAIERAAVSISPTLDSSELSNELQPIWYKLIEELSKNAKKVDIYLYNQFSRGNRATELIRLLTNNELPATKNAISLIESEIDDEVEEEYHRTTPSGKLFTILRLFVEEYLESIVPDELSQLRGALKQLEERGDPDIYAAVSLSCREIHEALLYKLVTEQVLAEGDTKPPEIKSHYNADKIVSWLKLQLERSAEEPLAHIERGFDLFIKYNKQLDKIIQRDVHKDKSDLTRQEITGHVLFLFSLYNELFLLLERAKFDWELVGRNIS